MVKSNDFQNVLKKNKTLLQNKERQYSLKQKMLEKPKKVKFLGILSFGNTKICLLDFYDIIFL